MIAVHIVYFVYINPLVKYLDIISGQVSDIIQSKLIQVSHLHIVLSGKLSMVTEAKQLITLQLHNFSDRVFFYETYDNHFEYQGILTLYELGHLHQDKILLYIHTKGMSYVNQMTRHPLNIILTRHTIWDWKQVLSIFEKDHNIKKICLFPGYSGYLFHNFFWVRGIYMTTCVKPQISENRYIYEMWISLSRNQSNKDTYNLYMHNQDLLTYNTTVINMRNLQIDQVFYGISDRMTNITDRFIEEWSKHTQIIVNNELAGIDPAEGFVKKLKIIFLNGLTAEFMEHSIIDMIKLIESMMFDVRNLRAVYYDYLDITSRFIYFWTNQITIKIDQVLTNCKQQSKLKLIYRDNHTQEFEHGSIVDTKTIVTYIRDHFPQF